MSDLPGPVPHFVNRKEELSDIKNFLSQEQALNDRCRCVLIHGAVGMGKTATAIQVANELRDNSENTAVIYVNCKYVSSRNDLAWKIATQVHHYPLNEPVSEVKRRLINESDLYTVVLLDNYEHLLYWNRESTEANTQPERTVDEAEAQEIMNFILEIVRDSAKVKLLVTSTENVLFPDTGQKWIRLLPLQHDDSFELLKKVYGDEYHLEKETSDNIATFCSGIPHALVILASQRDVPADLVEMMKHANAKQKLKKFTRIPIAGEDKKLDECLDACFDRLDPQLQDTLVALTLFRGRFAMQTAVAVFPGKTGQILELAQRSFLEQDMTDIKDKGKRRYSFLTVQKLYCQSKIQEPHFREVCRGARTLFIQYLLRFLKGSFKRFLSKDVLEAITAFRHQEEDIMQLLDWFANGAMEQQQKRDCIDTFNNVAELLAKMMGKKRFEAVFTKLKHKSEEIGDQKRLSECLTSLGIREVFNLFFYTCQQPKETDEKAKRQHKKTTEKAKQYLVDSHGIQTTHKINTGNSRAQCLAKLGRILAKENKFREAKDKIQQAIEIRIQRGEQDSVMLGATYNDMAGELSALIHIEQGGHKTHIQVTFLYFRFSSAKSLTQTVSNHKTGTKNVSKF